MKHRKTIELNQEAIKILRDNQVLHIHSQLRRGVRLFVNKAIRINQTREPFTVHDFPEISKKLYKNYVFHLRHCGLVEVIGKTVFTYYRVKGFRLDDFWEKLTSKPTGVSISNNTNFNKSNDTFITREDIYRYLLDNLADLEYPALHNIRLHFYHDILYKEVKSYFEEKKPWNITYNDVNKSFSIYSPLDWKSEVKATIILTRTKLVQIHIKNTLKPIAFNENGVNSLIAKLGGIRDYLNNYSNEIPQVLDWRFVRADFGIDCKRPINGPFPIREFKDFAGALVRLYAKSWPDGNRRLRLEKIINPNKPIKDVLGTFINI